MFFFSPKLQFVVCFKETETQTTEVREVANNAQNVIFSQWWSVADPWGEGGGGEGGDPPP